MKLYEITTQLALAMQTGVDEETGEISEKLADALNPDRDHCT